MSVRIRLPEGFSLREPDDHIVELWYKGEWVGRFSSIGASPATIEWVAQEHLKALAAEPED